MTALAFTGFRLASRQLQADNAGVLTSIFTDDVNLVSWQRQQDATITEYCRSLRLTMPLKRIVGIDTVQQDIGFALPDAPGKAALLADIALQCQMFACLMDCQQLGLRLETLHKPMCPKFHTDHLVCRLVCTYLGPATEWLDSTGITVRAAPFAVTLLKGSGWEGNEQQAIVHRSPASDLPRVLLTLDPM
ncbi:DUF1826 domain-containing protein [Rheinheimera nanhaiensis]|uniref:DUF1826 domain-containing protein n=1 Tax=Rheinheimera nanhaiensis E407-8 TaxID=562729 RepID=I1DVV5_9GAMM|nr:DUF1826 domain-containing protein [Rheinheimera nanhaiensis]GAB58183.1 hypothetical protein RNAN_1154 [Rheinheimera nanhaiensis E407-8]